MVKLALKVFLPHGWSWALWMIQRRHKLIAQCSGLGADRRLTAGWAAATLSSGTQCLPYCDNLTILGVGPELVQKGIGLMAGAFSRKGFLLHELTGVERGCSVFGFDESAGRIRLRARTWVSGQQVQVLIGQFVSMTILARPAFRMMRSLYDFVSMWKGRPRWPRPC